MRTRGFTLTDKEVAELKQAEQQTKRPDDLRRMQAVRLFGTGMEKEQISEITGYGERNLQRLAACYRKDGVAGLYDQRKGGNRARLSAEQRLKLRERLHQYRPVDLQVSVHEYWTVSDLKIGVERWFGVVYQSLESYYTLLHEAGFSLQRPAKMYRSRPNERTVADFEAALEKK